MLAINAFGDQVLTPRIQGSGLGLHPLVILLGVIFFGTLLGPFGVLLAVPIMGVLRILLPGLRRLWMESRLFARDGSPPSG